MEKLSTYKAKFDMFLPTHLGVRFINKGNLIAAKFDGSKSPTCIPFFASDLSGKCVHDNLTKVQIDRTFKLINSFEY